MQIHKLKPQFLNKIWGTYNLAGFNYDSSKTPKVGEVWLISAHPHGLSKFENGEELRAIFANKSYHFNNFRGEYPLLIKIIVPTDYLSVQVHPDDKYAQKHHQSLGKPESWYVLDAPKNSYLIYGHKAKTKQEIKTMIESQQWDNLLKKIPVKKGDFIYVPPGKVHAISPNVKVCEIQRSSDITYRFYDFDRVDENHKKRELHISESLDVITVPDEDYPIINKTSGLLINNPNFSVYLWDVTKNSQLDLSFFNPYWLQLVAVEGEGTINNQSFKFGEAAITFDEIEPLVGTGNLKVLISWVSPLLN